MTCFDIKLWDILCCFHYILNSPRTCFKKGVFILNDQFDKEVSYHVENIQHKYSGFYLSFTIELHHKLCNCEITVIQHATFYEAGYYANDSFCKEKIIIPTPLHWYKSI